MTYPGTMFVLRATLPCYTEEELASFIALAVSKYGEMRPSTRLEDHSGVKPRSMTLGEIREHALRESESE